MVKIIRCAELAAMDPNGYSDPFVKMQVDVPQLLIDLIVLTPFEEAMMIKTGSF